MAVSFGFYSALHTNNGYDRIYQSGEMSKLFDGLILDGIYLSAREDDPTNQQFMVSADTDNMFIKVAPGKAWFLGTYTISDSSMALEIEASDSADRIDAVCIEVNRNMTAYDPEPYTERFNNIKVVKGTPGDPAVKPEMVHADGIDQFPIAYITVPAGTEAIRPYDIEYVVGTETPYFAWLCENLSIAELYSKWKSILDTQTQPFVTWFASMWRMLGRGDEDYENIVEEVNTINSNDYIVGVRPRVDEQEYKTNGDGSTIQFTLTGNVKAIADIFVDGKMVYNYTFDSETNTVTLESAPPVGVNNIVIYYVVDADTYTIYF